jgi:NAD(P)H-hydrate epimerase
LNDASATIVAIDIPSGLMADSPSPGPVVKADFTVSFQLPKLAFFLPQCHAFVGRWFLVDIGLNKDFIKQVVASHFQVTKKDSRKILRRRSTFGHKGNFGHALLVAGSYGKMGAAVLASRGALRAGLGLLTTHIPRCGYDILQSSVPEAMTTVDSHQDVVSGIPLSARYNTIAIGPGLGTSPETVNAFRSLLEQFGKPMVIDADGLNILSENRECMHLVAPGSILTPHPGEFERLVGNWKDDFERLEKQKQLAHELKSVVVLKGAFTSIATPDGKVFFNSTGNPGMATGGSGDVLTGILAGFMAQGYEALHAALLGVYLHGLAGDLAAVDKGVNSLIASDIVNFLPSAFLSLRRE